MLVALFELLRVWEMVGLLMFSIDTVTFVLGDPMLEILVLQLVCCEAIQASPAPRPQYNQSLLVGQGTLEII